MLSKRSQLKGFQSELSSVTPFSARVVEAKSMFSSKNRKTNPVFRDVRATLDRMCQGARRCMYCEDSLADEVEHVRPKNFFPDQTFVWENYLYACGPCNGPKSDQFMAILSKVQRFSNGLPNNSNPRAMHTAIHKAIWQTRSCNFRTSAVLPSP